MVSSARKHADNRDNLKSPAVVTCLQCGTHGTRLRGTNAVSVRRLPSKARRQNAPHTDSMQQHYDAVTHLGLEKASMITPAVDPKGRCGAPFFGGCAALVAGGACLPRSTPPAIVELWLRTSSAATRTVPGELAREPALRLSLLITARSGARATEALSCFCQATTSRFALTTSKSTLPHRVCEVATLRL